MLHRSVLLLCILAVAPALLVVAAPDETECASLGFNKALTLCNDCDALEQAVHDAVLSTDCRACCVEEQAADDAGPFASAVLEMDAWAASAYGELNEFVEKLATAHPRFRVKTVAGTGWRSVPTLVLTPPPGGGEPVRVQGAPSQEAGGSSLRQTSRGGS
jgi:hypothetical protein